MTRTAFDFVRIEIPCLNCGKDSLHLIRKLITRHTVACSYCRATIDLRDRRAFINEAAECLKKIWVLKP